MFRVLSCLTSEHDWRLVALAGAVCYLASLAAMSLLQRARSTRDRARIMWIATAGIATGAGIWATHFIAMLAYKPGIPVAYDLGLTALSLLVAVAVTSAGLGLAVDGPGWRPPAGGAVVGAGIASMHYLGMLALEMPGRVAWRTDLVLASVLLGMAGSAAALVVARHSVKGAPLIAPALLTLAIVALHFTAMGAVEIVPDPTRAISELSLAPTSLALAIAGAATGVLGMTLVAAIADRRIAASSSQINQIIDQFADARRKLIEQSEEILREQNKRLDAALNNMTHGISMFDAGARLVLCNQRYLQMYNLSPAVVRPGCVLRDLLEHRKRNGALHGDVEGLHAEIIEAARLGKTMQRTMELEDGRLLSLRSEPLPGGGWVATHEDITELKRAEGELRRTRKFLDMVVENIPVTLFVKSASDQRYLLLNKAGERLFGLRRDQVIGRTSPDVFGPELAERYCEHDRALLTSEVRVHSSEDVINSPRNGTRVVACKKLIIQGDDGKPEYLLGLLDDITERKRAEERVVHMANHDMLSGLPNRVAFNEQLSYAVNRAAAAGTKLAVMTMDLDRLRGINDVFGHPVGDALIRAVAERLRARAEASFVAHLGGDEFALVATDMARPEAVAQFAERLLAAMGEAFEIGEHRLHVGLSIGVAVFPADGLDTKALLANADAALQRAKNDGRATVRFFEPEMDTHLRERRALQHDLRGAIEGNELLLHYQPQASIEGEVVGFEALLRWQHPERGLVLPGKFIPLAEESSLIVPLGEWILRAACREAASWPRPLNIAVNLSPVQFQHGDLAGAVHAILLETGLAANRLELEITEGVLIGDFSRATSILRRLKTLGVRIAMDDFGTGYSSLSYLQSFPFDKIKIDKTFISNVERSPQSATIVRAVIGLARGLDMPVVAEGVETDDQLVFLANEACNEVQGYLVGRPGPIEGYAEVVGRPAGRRKAARR